MVPISIFLIKLVVFIFMANFENYYYYGMIGFLIFKLFTLSQMCTDAKKQTTSIWLS